MIEWCTLPLRADRLRPSKWLERAKSSYRHAQLDISKCLEARYEVYANLSKSFN
jgi:hypothetical protein